MGQTEKQKLREVMRRVRDTIPEKERAVKCKAIGEHLLKEDWYVQAEKLFVYAAIRSEVDLSAFFQRARQDGKQLYFPKVRGEELDFFRIDREEQLSLGAFGVMEPVTEDMLSLGGYEKQMVAGPAWTAEPGTGKIPILVPGLAFSRAGIRMGYGKGYYDRYLAAQKELLQIGICFEAQFVMSVPAEPHDCKMARIITERGVYSVE